MKILNTFLKCGFVSFFFIYPVMAYRGIFIMTSGSRSNMNFFEGVTEALVQNGHNITLITPHKASTSPDIVNRIVINDMRDKLMGNKFESTFFSIVKVALEYIPSQCVNVLTNPKVQEVLQEKYDYIMLAAFATDCFLGYAYEKKLPIIYVNQNSVLSGMGEKFGMYSFPILNPSRFLGKTYPMTFLERVYATLVDIVLIYAFTSNNFQTIETICREKKLWKKEIPDFNKLQKQNSFMIANAIRVLEYPPQALTPTVIYAGGIHLKTRNTLSEDIKEWIEGSGKDGFILFSLGTAVRTSDMKTSNLKSLLKVFASLRQRVVWKWDSEVPDLPPNVKIFIWLPQQELLAHPKIKLFISHGGLFSIIEATYYKVPILGVPIYMDQTGNVAQAVKEGWAKGVSWKDFDESLFRESIVDLIHNNTYRQVISKRSKLMREWPTDPAKEVVYWVNYAIEHDGAPHLQSPLTEYSWFQLFNLDVWLFIIAAAFGMLSVIVFLLVSCFKLICRSKKEKTQ